MKAANGIVYSLHSTFCSMTLAWHWMEYWSMKIDKFLKHCKIYDGYSKSKTLVTFLQRKNKTALFWSIMKFAFIIGGGQTFEHIS